MKKKKEACEPPDILNFLNLSRTIVRQIDLLKSTDLPLEYKDIAVKAAKKVEEKTTDFIEGENV